MISSSGVKDEPTEDDRERILNRTGNSIRSGGRITGSARAARVKIEYVYADPASDYYFKKAKIVSALNRSTPNSTIPGLGAAGGGAGMRTSSARTWKAK